MARLIFAILINLTFILVPQVVFATPISLTFTATIQSVDPAGPFATASGSFAGGAIFDSVGTPITNSSYPDVNYGFFGTPYVFYVNVSAAPPWASSINVSGMPASGNNYVTVDVADNGAAGLFASDTVWFGTKASGVVYSIQFSGPNSSFASGEIPSVATLASFYTSATVRFTDSAGTNFLVANVDSAQFTPVPIPLPLALLVSGMAWLGAVGIRRKYSLRPSGFPPSRE